MAALLTVLTTVLIAPSAAAAAPCRTPWTAGVDTSPTMDPAPLVSVRAGSHPCFDRVVFQVAGSTGAGWDARYVDVVRTDGAGAALPVPGGARLEVRLHHPAHDEHGAATFDGREARVAGYPTLRSVVYGGSFEGYTLFGVGTRARLPFRVFALPGPGGDTRIVLDVAHRW